MEYNNQNSPILKSVFVKGVIGEDSRLFDNKKQVAFIGRSNVGKSSVINFLTNKKDLAKSSSLPGKTREINLFNINDNMYFVDLPGYGYAKMSPKDADKMRKRIIWYFSNEKIKPDPIIVILDMKIGVTDLDKEMLGILQNENHRVVVLANKSDKLSQSEMSKQTKKIDEDLSNYPIVERIIPFSTKKGRGKNELLNLLFS